MITLDEAIKNIFQGFTFYIRHKNYYEKVSINYKAFDRMCDKGFYIPNKLVSFDGKTSEYVKMIDALSYEQIKANC